MKAVIFARVSTQEQAQEGYSVDSQVSRLTEYCKKHNFTIIEIFRVSESSTKGEKKEFNRMLNLVKAQKEKVAVVVDKVDRLNRKVSDLPKIDELMSLNNAEIHFLDIGKLDNEANTQQKLMFRVMTVIGNTYNDNLSDHGKKTYLHKMVNGECPRIAPIGYLNVKDGSKSIVVIDKARGHLIRKMFEMYSLGNTSLGDLEKFAKDNNLTNTFFKGSTKTIAKNVISCFLKNPFYYGEMYSEKLNKFFPHKYEPLISKALFDICQKVTEARSKKNNREQSKQTAKNHEKEFLFRNMIKCGTTGRVASPDRKDKRRTKVSYYAVYNPESGSKKVWVNEDDILAEIGGVFKSMQIPKDMLEDVKKHLDITSQAEEEYHKEKITLLKKQLKSAEGKIEKLLDIKLDSDSSITTDMFNKKSAEIQKEIANLKTDIAMHDVADEEFKALVITVFQIASDAYDLFEYGTLSERRSLIEFVLSDIKLTGKKLSYTLRKPFDLMVNLGTCSDWLPKVPTFLTNNYQEFVDFNIIYHTKCAA